jgi:hypothetical protein
MINTTSRRLINLTNQLIFSKSTTANTTASNIDYIEGNGLPKIVLNKPKALNSLNLQMIRDLAALIPKI